MQILKNIQDYNNFKINYLYNKKIGFVPTMGALHIGHASLIEKSKAENDLTVVSIFVNPRQFNDIEDFNKYPRTIKNDIDFLKSLDCDILFLPDTNDIYENYESCSMIFNGLDKIYEGEFRPGHFQGVVDIVYRLFEIIEPTNAYFGEKDFQQLTIIKLMVEQKKLNVNIISCKIVREISGLAMSSRNKRLSENGLKQAPEIFKIISNYLQKLKISDDLQIILQKIKSEINNFNLLNTEYIIFCDSENLQTLQNFYESKKIKLCIAVWCENVRLIDNYDVFFNG